MEDWDPDRSPADDRDRQDDQGLLARRGGRQDSRRAAIRSSATRAIRTRFKMNSDYFVALAQTFEERYGVKFEGIREGPGHRHARAADPVQDEHRRRDVGARQERPGRLAGRSSRRDRRHASKDDLPLRIDVKRDPFLDDRLRVANLPEEPQTLTVKNPVSGAEKQVKIALFRKAGEVAGARRGDLRDHQVAELRHRQPRADAGRGSLGVGQPRARQPLGPLRSRDQSARHAAEGRDSGSRQRVDAPSASSARTRRSIPTSSPASGRSAAPTARSRR